jgi:NAD-dependent deacetylase
MKPTYPGTCNGIVKPDIVLFGEAVQALAEASTAAANSDLFLVIGSSPMVLSAAVLPRYVGGPVTVVNQGHMETALPHWLRISEAADAFFARVASALSLSTAEK